MNVFVDHSYVLTRTVKNKLNIPLKFAKKNFKNLKETSEVTQNRSIKLFVNSLFYIFHRVYNYFTCG